MDLATNNGKAHLISNEDQNMETDGKGFLKVWILLQEADWIIMFYGIGEGFINNAAGP